MDKSGASFAHLEKNPIHIRCKNKGRDICWTPDQEFNKITKFSKEIK